jgi:hypothetical protein
MEMFGATSDIFLKFLKTLAKDAAGINDTPYSTTFSYWQKRLSNNPPTIQCQSPPTITIQIARVTGLLREDHNDLNNSILNDRHIYAVVV